MDTQPHNLPSTTSSAATRVIPQHSRRRFLELSAAGTACFAAPGAYAAALTRTPKQTEGPFYPSQLPLDTDNDLVIINDDSTPADGEVTWLSGRVLDTRGKPLRNVLVEIWQCDQHGVYLHPGSSHAEKRDRHFQGFGRFITGSTGEYLFRTIKPVPYPGRTPHIHVAIKMKGQEKWTTQCYIRGHPGNPTDGIWKEIKDPRQRQSVTIPFTRLPGSRSLEWAARFDLVPGFTPVL